MRCFPGKVAQRLPSFNYSLISAMTGSGRTFDNIIIYQALGLLTAVFELQSHVNISLTSHILCSVESS